MGSWSRARVAAVVLLVVLALSAVALASHSVAELRRFDRAEARRSAVILAAGQSVSVGANVRALDLGATLARLQYTETRAAPTAPGQFHKARSAWAIVLRRAEPGADGARAERVRLDVAGDRIVRVWRDGESVASVTLEEEVLTGVGDRPGEDYRPVRLAEVPPALVDAVIAAEDHRFFEHGGLDLRGLLRAAWANLRARRVTQGGSTITQQLVKLRLLTPRRTLGRKLREAWLAAIVEWRYPKERILEGYLNEIYLGQRGPLAIRGVGAAARAFFGKEVHQLTLADAAQIAALIRAPNSYSPALNPERARERRNTVLATMRQLGKINDGDYRAALAAPVTVVRSLPSGQRAPYFTDYVRQQLEEQWGEDGFSETPFARVRTPLDPALQRFAESAVARGLDRLESRLPRLRRTDPRARLEAALIALDPATGHVKALVGGRDYRESQFNRATLARRQPGSAFKPFVYAAALGLRHGTPPLTLASFVDDSPIVLSVDGKPWSPRNYEDRYEGRVRVRRALEGSLNAATVRVAQTAGLGAVIETARVLGIESDLRPVPALSLGAFEVTPIELARAYLAMANGGMRPRGADALVDVETIEGTWSTISREPPARALSPAEAYLMTSLLAGVIQSGTAAQARTLGVQGDVAGKTGTTNDGRDAWFVGYSSNLLALVWVGLDNGEPHGLSGAEAALPLWADFMRQALQAYPAAPFGVPSGVTFAEIDTTNGKLANRFCPLVAQETFLTGTEPPPCTDHGGAADQLMDWWKRLRDWFRR